MDNPKKLWATGALFCLTAVILGAMGAHALEKHLTVNQLNSFETGVRFQFFHGLALLIIPSISFLTQKSKKLLYLFFTVGTIIFSVSIYLLTTDEIWNMDLGFLGPITPIGGSLLIIGWFILLWKIISYKYVKD